VGFLALRARDWSVAVLRGGLQRGGVRNQSPQAPPRGGNETRQTRRPLRGDRAGRGHQRVAVPSSRCLGGGNSARFGGCRDRIASDGPGPWWSTVRNRPSRVCRPRQRSAV